MFNSYLRSRYKAKQTRGTRSKRLERKEASPKSGAVKSRYGLALGGCLTANTHSCNFIDRKRSQSSAGNTNEEEEEEEEKEDQHKIKRARGEKSK